MTCPGCWIVEIAGFLILIYFVYRKDFIVPKDPCVECNLIGDHLPGCPVKKLYRELEEAIKANPVEHIRIVIRDNDK